MQVLRKAFTQQLDAKVSALVNSVDADQALITADIKGSIAHATMLAKQGLIDTAQGANIVAGLNQILQEHASGEFTLNAAFEDVHMNVEKRLEQIIGEDALRLHTARSRNDQVALDLRLYVLEQIELRKKELKALKSAITQCAAQNIEAVMPGYTHLQRAQPVLFAHALLAFVEMFERDAGRFDDLVKRAAVSPLGAGAQAGTGLNIDVVQTAQSLGMSVFANSIDAVSDRDFVAEYLFAASMCSVHLSQLAETLIIWASREFSFISLTDAVTTASSLMPQKKNPDPLEIIRGKCGFMTGELVNVLTTLKGLPLGYNRDLQESKPPAIKVSGELSGCIEVMTIVVQNLSVNADVTLKAASDPDMITTDLVEHLVNKNVPFRQAHEQVSALMAEARELKVPLCDMTLAQMQAHCPALDVSVAALFSPTVSVEAKQSHGSTSVALVKAKVKAKVKALNQ